LAAVKATTIQKRKRRDSKKSWEDTRTSRSHSTKQTYFERPEQSPETQHTQRQGREISASKSAEQNYMRKNQATKEASTGSITHIIRKSYKSRNFKRSTRCPHPLQTLGNTNMSTLLRRDFW
jgi:hypothetical protein